MPFWVRLIQVLYGLQRWDGRWGRGITISSTVLGFHTLGFHVASLYRIFPAKELPFPLFRDIINKDILYSALFYTLSTAILYTHLGQDRGAKHRYP